MLHKSKYPDSIPAAHFRDNLGQFYWHKLQEFHDNVLFIDQVSGRKWNGAQLQDKAERVARFLVEKLKLEAGSNLYFYAVNDDYLQIAALGAVLAGCPVCVGAPGEPKTEVAYMTNQVAPKVLFVASEHCKQVVEMMAHKMISSDILICLMDDKVCDELVAHRLPYVCLHRDILNYEPENPSGRATIPRLVDPNTAAYILFTSGSTGRPKAVARTHRNSIYVAHSLKTTNGELWPLNRNSVVAGHLQLDHGTGVFNTKMCLSLGYTLILMDGFEFERMGRAIDDYGITDMSLGSALIHNFITRPQEDLKKIRNLSKTLRSIVAIGSPIASHKAPLDFMARYPQVSIRQAFGMTECGFVSILPHADCRTDFTSVGHLLPNLEIKLINRDSRQASSEQGEITMPGVKGELYVRGPTVAPGYMGSEQSIRTDMSSAFMPDGFYRSNDVACISPETGKLHLFGRYNDMLCLYDGWKVLPQEIEEVLMEHEGIKEAGVIGAPHPELPTCHAPRAYIVPTPEWAPRLKPGDVHAYTQRHLSVFKQLTGGIVIMDEPLPRGSLQKLDRKRLYLRYKTETHEAA